MTHTDYLLEAIALAEENINKAGGGPFGAVIVKGEEIIARAANSVTTSNDPTAHAEVNAIRQACKALDTFDLSDCILYASCEPCPMCLSAIYWSRITEVYYAGDRFDAQNAGFDDSFIYDDLDKPNSERRVKIVQLLAEEGKSPMAHWKADTEKVPY